MADLGLWAREHLHLPASDVIELLNACETVIALQSHSMKLARAEALDAQSRILTGRVTKLQRHLSSGGDKELTDSFNDVLAELTEQSHRDPKTTLLQFPRFMQRLEQFLGFERRHQWCAVGLVDIADFKWYNDTVGPLVGARIVECVGRILAEEIRSDDLLTGECQLPDALGERDLHARFGGDEFCFLIPGVASFNEACSIAQRFKTVVERYDWAAEHPVLAERPVFVDVGMVCVQLGPLVNRQGRAAQFAAELVQGADLLMFAARNERAPTVRALALRVNNGELIELFGWESAARAKDPAAALTRSATAR